MSVQLPEFRPCPTNPSKPSFLLPCGCHHAVVSLQCVQCPCVPLTFEWESGLHLHGPALAALFLTYPSETKSPSIMWLNMDISIP